MGVYICVYMADSKGGGIMDNIKWRVVGDCVLIIEEIESLPDMPPIQHVCKLIDKKTFIECYKKWIEGAAEECIL